MLEYLTDLITRLGQWSYLLIFAVATAESAAFLGLLVPGESVVLIAGFLAGQGVLDLDALIVTVTLGATLADNLGYELGRRLGRPWAARHGTRFGLDDERLRKADAFFGRHGGKAVFLGRFVGFARALVPFIAGSTRMRYAGFLLYNALGASLWTMTVVLLGYFVGRLAERWIGKASAVLAAGLLMVLVLAWLWRWIVRREATLKERWARVREHPVGRMLEGFAPQAAWLRRRLSPESYFGLQLTLGVVLFAGAAWMFGGIAEDVVTDDPLTVIDTIIAKWLHEHSVWWLTAFASFVSRLHDWIGIAALTILLIFYLSWKRQWQWAVTVACTVAGGMLLNVILKLIFHRARPSVSDLAATPQTYSFPSGHVMAATLFYGVTAAYVAARLSAWRWRVLAVLVALALVGLVAFSRMVLGVHYLRDVLAAAAAGIAWVAVCDVAVNTLWNRRGFRPKE